MRHVQITTIVENTCPLGAGVIGEHGLSMLIESDGYRVLLDAAAGTALMPNARAMKIDLSAIDAIVLSHCHRDHTGGLKDLLAATGPKPIYAHPDVLGRKYSVVKDHPPRFNGLAWTKEELAAMGGDLRLSAEPTHLKNGIIVTGEIPRVHSVEAPSKDFQRLPVDKVSTVPKPTADDLVWDHLPDDQSIIVDGDRGFTLISGCSHSGIINTMQYAERLMGKPMLAFVGGTHLIDAGPERLAWTIDILKKSKAEVIAASHCTGFKASAELYHALGERYRSNNVGTRIELTL